MFDLIGESFPRHILPVSRNVLRSVIVSEVSLIDQVSSAFPYQRGTLPRLIPGQQSEQSRSAFRIVGSEKLAFTLRSFNKFIFQWRTAFENSDQVLETLLSGIRHFGRPHGVGHMADECDALLFRLVRNRKH